VEGRKNSAARIRANNKYAAKAYDRINIAVPKGRKNEIKALADTQGQSVNAYIISAIDEKIGRDGGAPGAAGGPQEIGVVPLPSSTLKAAQEAAQAAGEGLPQFIGRAVETQARRDALSRKMKGGS